MHLDLDEVKCAISIGSSDLMSGSQGLIATFLAKIEALNCEFVIECVIFEGDEARSYLCVVQTAATTLNSVKSLVKRSFTHS